MKTSKAIIVASVIFLAGIVFYSLSNRYYIDTSTKLIVDRLTGKVTRPEVPTPMSTPTPTHRYSASDFEQDKGDFSKVIISGDSKTVNAIEYEISCTIKNDDSIPHRIIVKAIFFDKNKKPILTEESNSVTVGANDIESVVISTFTNVENISSYELKLNQSDYGGILRNR